MSAPCFHNDKTSISCGEEKSQIQTRRFWFWSRVLPLPCSLFLSGRQVRRTGTVGCRVRKGPTQFCSRCNPVALFYTPSWVLCTASLHRLWVGPGGAFPNDSRTTPGRLAGAKTTPKRAPKLTVLCRRRGWKDSQKTPKRTRKPSAFCRECDRPETQKTQWDEY